MPASISPVAPRALSPIFDQDATTCGHAEGKLMRNVMLAMSCMVLTSACGTIGSANLSSEGPSLIGKPAQALFTERGAPLRQITSPGGATVYVYEAHNLYGATFCEASFYVRNQIVVGFLARGFAPTCGGTAGNLE
jgi:hypothetical protein